MKTSAISLIEKKPHRDGGTYDHLKSLEVYLVKNDARTILLQEIIVQKEFQVLLHIQNQQLTTLLDCTGVTPYEIWYFDEKFQFTGKAYSLHEGSGTFQIQTQAKWVLFVHLHSKEFKDLQGFNCSELDITDKYGIIKRDFPYGYGVFPYLIVKHEKSPCFSQIPIHINPSEDNLPGWSIVMRVVDTSNEEVLTLGAAKGLSKEDSMGILFQACRKRKDGIVADLNTVKNRLEVLVQVRKRKFPYTFNTFDEFENYADNIIGSTIDKFGFKKNDVYYTGSSITNQQSIGGGAFDTDWAIEYTESEMMDFLKEMEKRWLEAKDLGLGNKPKDKIRSMYAQFRKEKKIDKRYIIFIEELPDGTKTLTNLENYLEAFPISIKTDLTPVIKNINVGYPRIKYNFN